MKYNDKEYSACGQNSTSCTWAEFNTFIDSITVSDTDYQILCENVAAPTPTKTDSA
jgi:hypothetical protein